MIESIASLSEPLVIATQMESSRLILQNQLLGNRKYRERLIRIALNDLGNGAAISDLVSHRSNSNDTVQNSLFVQEKFYQTLTSCLKLSNDPQEINKLYFLPCFLLEVAADCIQACDQDDDPSIVLAIIDAANSLNQHRRQMIFRNTGLVGLVAHKNKTTTLSFDDLMQEGMIGLIKAIDRFDPSLGYQFSTYAIHWIKQAVSRLISKQEKIVRLPMALAEKAGTVFEAMRQHYLLTERWPTIDQLKQQCDMSEDEIKTIHSYYQATHSLDAVDENDGENTQALMERMQQQQFAEPLNELIDRNLSQYLNKAVATLPDKEATIINMRFGLKNHSEMTLQGVADHLHVTRERVRQLQNQALQKLKHQFGFDLQLFLEPNDSYQ